MNDEKFMHLAIEEAKLAADENEVPIGAVAVIDDVVVGRSHNVRERTNNPLGHAELLLIESLAKDVKSWRLEDVTIYVTCEPCIMCTGSMLQARVKRVVYGCKDPKAGAMGSLYDLAGDDRLNHKIEVTSGVLGDECAKLLIDFFRRLRGEKQGE
ncbi:MAG: nucleoside deaminase [Deltaproteobacteria bacterium]|jgi:tRNA(adenine34) deaminase|nr:nucleoside deaminase [Deltaproteobacteria bacterium]